MTTLLVDARPVDHPTARRRGIGRYVTGLLAGLRDIGAPVIALYGTDTEAEVLADAVTGLTLRRWTPQVVRDHATDGTWYLATQLMLHPIPLDPIPSVITAARMPVAAVMYDVIPYRHPEIYLTDAARRQAELRAPLARTVDALLAISDFAATTAAAELAFPRDRIATIGAGVDAMFRPAVDDPRARYCRVLPADVARYVVTVGGGDDRKNIEGLLRAWAHVDRALGDDIHLVVVGAHTPALASRWRRWASDAGVADRVVLTGGLDDDELVAVLQGAVLSVMPSLEEGFGLPVLEAAACGVPAISSNVSSLPEVLDEPASCFDPGDPKAIADAIVRAVGDEAHRSALLAAGARATARWSWPNVASATIDALEALGPRRVQRVRPPVVRLAFAGAFDAAADTATDTAADTAAGAPAVINDGVVEALRAGGHEVTALVDHGGSPEPTRASGGRWPVRALGRFVKPWDFDHIVAVLGAAPRHIATSAMARRVACHLWVHDDAVPGVRYGANLAALDIARSLIVDSDDAAVRLGGAGDRPILVLDPGLAVGEAATALAGWLADVDDLDAWTIRHHPTRVTSPDP